MAIMAANGGGDIDHGGGGCSSLQIGPDQPSYDDEHRDSNGGGLSYTDLELVELPALLFFWLCIPSRASATVTSDGDTGSCSKKATVTSNVNVSWTWHGCRLVDNE